MRWKLNEIKTKIVNLTSNLNLPKGTEAFISDIHGNDDKYLKKLANLIKSGINEISRGIETIQSQIAAGKKQIEEAKSQINEQQKIDVCGQS